ncbi:hypothetical protein [Cryobacterium sp. CG_9.6]|uniref:hypothetical protein n=1 Tax=Cryobacterium sp. CG_9.6 TaxID=2760710 RepID=UPI002473A7E8|nr:hypothetical protein [Cryobacterium sp. CG_9.6]MDH6236144.1 hypothetical protein [Cryobacterium sp. CG_9.6]
MKLSTRALTLSLVLALGATGALSGCASIGNVVNGTVKEATGGQVNLGGELPDGWPSEVPVIDGEILFGAGNAASGQSGWVVTIKTASADPLTEARTQLEEAGFVTDTSASNGEAGAVAMKNDAYRVVVVGNSDGVLYTVTLL